MAAGVARREGTAARLRSPFARFVLIRVALLPVTLLAVLSISFLVTSVLPVDPARSIAGNMASDEVVAAIRERLGLDPPLGERFTAYLSALASGDLGRSYVTDLPIGEEILDRLPASLTLVVPALVLAAVLGIGLGVVAAYFANRPPAWLSGGLVTTLQAIPDFLLALALIVLFATTLGWLPGPEGQLGIGVVPPPRVTGSLPVDAFVAGQWEVFWDSLRHLVLPVLTLGLSYSVLFARISAALIGRALTLESTRFARASGWSEWRVVRSCLLIARVPLLTYTAMLLAGLMGGAAIVESVFSWGGIGQWTIDSMQDVDLPVIQAIVLFSGAGTVAVYLAMDVVSGLLDPRIPLGKGVAR